MSSPGPDSILPGDGTAEPNPTPSARAEAIANVLLQLIERRSRGEVVADTAVIAAHPELMPELGMELAALRELQHARLAAQKAGPITEPADSPQTDTNPNHACANSHLHCQPGQHAQALYSRPSHPAIQGYSILEEIDSGGQGAVFKALQQSTGRVVAIKVIPGGALISSRHRARFQREVDILATLDHPSIVGILDRGRTADESLFMVMDFIDGCSLDEYVHRCRREEPENTARLVRLFAEIAHALQDAHARGIVHRDLKPSNIRIDKRGRPHILDFGLARLMPNASDEWRKRTVTTSGQIIGSLPWASPEQVSGCSDDADTRSDVYALGVMLYQALTGRFPYSVAGAMPDVVDNILHAIPLPPSQVGQLHPMRISRVLDAIVLKALAKLPSDRYASAGELAFVLEDYLARRPVPGLKLARPLWWRWELAATLLGLIFVTSAAMLWRNEPRAESVYVAPLKDFTNSIGMRFVRIPAGTFLMGSPPNDVGRYTNEHWQPMSLPRPFYLAVTEVTQRQYRLVMGAFPCEQQEIADDLPVHGVTWLEAVEFCSRLSATEGRRYRLPTEVEWEYACRAGATTPFGGVNDLEQMGWYAGNSGGRIHPIKRKLPNHWGLYDMHGNVREWCQDIYQVAYPADALAQAGRPVESSFHVVRGGGAIQSSRECRSASRGRLPPETRAVDVGFRVLLDSDDANAR